MASTSASSIQKRFKYDVFLSFRGEDTRKNFVDHLYHAFKQNGIYTYKDDEEISKGKAISDELIRSIEDSRIYIIVFSKTYASSSWCLNELVKIMECQTKGQIAYPIFYDVEPTEVRNQSGVVGEAFANHVNEEAAGRWRDALKKAASLAGRELKNTFDGHEAKFIQKVVEEISKELPSINCSVNDGKLVGMEKRVEDVVSSLGIDIDDFRMIIGIKGMGGAGKTTLARAVFDQISSKFEGSSFIDKVRERSKDLACGLESLQHQVLSDVLNKKDITVNNVYDGTTMMKQRMRDTKVLLVLDDVDHIDQLEALAGDPSWFKPGSRVIITTRDEQVLKSHRLPLNMILDINLLSDEEAYCLFNRYAFGSDIPNQGFEVLSGQAISYAAGLPLTIKVLGSSLCGQDESVWKGTLDRLKTIPLAGTLEKLELSYFSLEDDYKEMFLDVACILKGWEKERASRAIESCHPHGRLGLRVLEQKSLITLSSQYLDMHDSIVEMGKNIVRRLYPNMPYRHSRLWIKEEIEDILVEDKGTEETRCIKVKLVDRVIIMKGLRKMKDLRYLEVNGSGKYYHNRSFNHHNIDVDSLHLPNSLRYLRWDDYPFTCLPKKFSANNLVGLEMRYSKIDQLWKGGEEEKVLKKFRFIDLDICQLRTLDVGLTMNLERLCLRECSKLVELHMPIESCKLKCLEIIYCKLIRTLDLERAHNLDTLTVSCCGALVELRMPTERFKLKHLIVNKCFRMKNIYQILNSDTTTLNLVSEHEVELHMSVENPKPKSINFYCSKWRTLDLGWWGDLDKLNIDKHETLVQLHLTFIKIRELSLRQCSKLKTITLTETINLKKLYLEECRDLVEVHIPIRCFELEIIEIHSSKLETLNLIGTRNLKELRLFQCEDLLTLHMPIGSHALEIIEIHSSKLKTLNLEGTRNLKELRLFQCEDLLKLHMPIRSPKLKIVEIHSSKLRNLNLTHTQNLKELRLFQCEDLLKLHMPIRSPKLKIVEIHSSKLRNLNLTHTRNLEKLQLCQCEDLVELHMPIGSPERKTIIIKCSKMTTLYLGLSPCLEHLDLSDCCKLVEIQAPVGCLSGSFMFKPCLGNQGFPMDGSLPKLRLTTRSLGICPLHLDINSPKFHFECIYNGIPLSFKENLVKLISLGQCACTNLASFLEIICGLQLTKLTLEGSIPKVPKDLDKLECLEELRLLSTNIEHFPDSIFMLKHLKVLWFKACWFLKQLPEDIDRLEFLEELHVTDCKSLRDIPNSICEMKRLKSLHLTDCILVKKLPKEIGRLECLKELNIKGTSIIDFPLGIDQLEDLTVILDGA